ncbi:PREDICTED: epidermal growth factor receptor kinase substrate 8-like protein 3 [Nanorana parkeri]|uniref:epidermal growth factor receptor kinase substrate 8-like protein 3 n=1 Tax=Nanorana parkeri TaxID=125878 RepID=UPI0008543C44|nr:PREDICTED: epidermal growth factor receptor kinase substrate 8-like protein 3 [Nanorana parkeri]
MDEFLNAIDGVLAQHGEPFSNYASRPSAKNIYEQRKQYAKTVSNDTNNFQHRVEHLLTCELGNDIRYVEDCLKRLQILNSEGKVWGQDMILKVQNGEVVLSDLESRDSLENIPLQYIENCRSKMGHSSYNSILAVTVQNKGKSSIMLFQCEEQPKPDGTYRMTADYRGLNREAPPLKSALPDMISITEKIAKEAGEYHAVIDLANAFFSIPIEPECQDQFAFVWYIRQYIFTVLPQGYLHSPTICYGLIAQDLSTLKLKVAMFHYSDDIMISGTGGYSPISQRKFEPGSVTFQPPFHTQSPGNQAEDIKRDIEVLNHVLGDIEIFVGNLDLYKKKKKGKTAIPESDFLDCLQKIKYAFNLLAKVQDHMFQPTAADLVHMLFNILPKILSNCPRKDMSSSVLSPFPTQKALLLLSSCVSDKERKLWENLGDAWLRTRADWPNAKMIPPYTPVFSDGWILPDINTVNEQPQHSGTPERHRNFQQTPIKVLYDFEARNQRELSVRKGDRVKVLDQSRQWWMVENVQGQRGFIPNNILESTDNGQLPGQIPTSIKPHSTPGEVTAWLQNKGFSRITVKCLGILTGNQLLELSRQDLKAVCPEEGGRVFTQLNDI